MSDYPNDADGQVLAQLAKHGLDMTKPANFEYFVDSPDEHASIQIEIALKQNGYKTEIYYDEGELEEGEVKSQENSEYWPSWTVYVFVHMVPQYEEIIRIQKHLDIISKPYGGRSDGWQVGI